MGCRLSLGLRSPQWDLRSDWWAEPELGISWVSQDGCESQRDADGLGMEVMWVTVVVLGVL